MRAVELLTDFWLPLTLAVLGIGGTIAVTVVQLHARRAELDDERNARAAADLEARREAVLEAVYDSIGPLAAAATVPREQRSAVPPGVTAATAKVARVIRLSGRSDRLELHEWFAISARIWAASTNKHDLEGIESEMLAEIDAWFDGRATAEQIRERVSSRA